MSRRLLWAGLLTAVLLHPMTVCAQAYQDKAWQRVDAATLAFHGEILPRRFLPGEHPVGDADLLARNLTPETRTLVLESGGGDVAVALEMARLIHGRQLDVVVEGRCASACALLPFLAGRRKTVAPGGVVEFHSTNSLDPRDTADARARLTAQMEAIRGQIPNLAQDGVTVTPPDLGGATVEAILAARRQNAAGLRQAIAALYREWGVAPALLDDIDQAADAYLADHPGVARDQVWWCLAPGLLAGRYGVTGLEAPAGPPPADVLANLERTVGGAHLVRER
ncbi:hypothetical protein UAJ10_22495 [Nitrospirillum sp. BR 11164]|uniref:hypothetical protein n=1 Tax=Nitrospirillum sp. BR 11164 TaxID=3104324 RepID=UPI002AFDFA6D|nr:hypothetical protein [Nitrospirillum sp. BR 11164]MEA1651771.1 hypothetical protein [Nitrospirillum sp. BR 11164]